MEQAYAQALWKMVSEGMTPKKAVGMLRETLIAHGRERILPHIARTFVRVAERAKEKNSLVLTVAREGDVTAAKKETKKILEEVGAAFSEVSTVVDETLIGGWRLEGREHLVDASFKKHLLSIYNRATQ